MTANHKWHWLWVVAAAATLAAYGAALSPLVSGGDGGELIVTACNLEVAHPPGYPLYTMLGWLFCQLPLSTPAWRMGLMSALCSMGASLLVGATVYRMTGRHLLGITMALLFALSPLVWQWGTEAEVFALHHLLLATLLYQVVRWSQQGPSWQQAALIGTVMGLGLSHHHSIVFFVGPAALYLLHSLRIEPGRGRPVGWASLGLIIGLSPYIYLPLAGSSATLLSMGDPTTLEGFVHHLLRRDYGTFQLTQDGSRASFTAALGAYGASLSRSVLYVGLVPLGAGLWAAKDRKGPARLIVVSFVFYIVGFFALANIALDDPLLRSVLERFFTHGHLLATVVLALGVDRLLEYCPPRHQNRIIATLLVGVVAISVAWSKPAPRTAHLEQFAIGLVESVPRGSILLTRGDLATNSIRYVQSAPAQGDGVTVLDQELLTRPWYVKRARHETDLVFPAARYHPSQPDGFSLAQLLEANPDRQFFVFPDVKPGDVSLGTNHNLMRWGLAVAVSRSPLSLEGATRAFEKARRLSRPNDKDFGPETWEAVVRRHLDDAFAERGLWLLQQGIAGSDISQIRLAKTVFSETITRQGDSATWQLYKNLGLAAARLAPQAPAEGAIATAAWREYLARAPADEKDRVAIERAVETMNSSPPATGKTKTVAPTSQAVDMR